MALLYWLVLAAASDATIPVGPAPGAPPASAIVVSGDNLALDADGRGRIAADAVPRADGLTFYRTAAATAGEQVLYHPSSGGLVAWPLADAADARATAEIVLKRHEGETWENAYAFAAPLEGSGPSRRVRFWIDTGRWDAAVLVGGYAPAFALDVHGDPGATIAPARLVRGGRVTAKVLDARTARPPDRWSATLSRVAADLESEESKFFAKRPVAAGGPTLDFASLPLGGWELHVEAKSSRRRELVSMFRAGSTADLGTLYLSDAGKIRISVDFPVEPPPAVVECRALSLSTAGGRPTPAGSRTAAPAEHMTLELDGLEPGHFAVECGSAGLLYRQTTAVVAAGETADVRFSFSPVVIEGTVRRGETLAVDARIMAPVGGPSDAAPETRTDELGQYRIQAWPAQSEDQRPFVELLVSALGEQYPAVDRVDLEPGQTRADHDVLLPLGRLRGRVVDAKTLAPVEGATIRVEPSEVDRSDPGAHGFSLSSTSSPDGTFDMRNLEERELDVEVFRRGYGTARLRAVRPDGQELDVRLEAARRFEGIVVDEAGTPLPGVLVGVDVDPEGLLLARKTTTSDDGRFSFDDIGAGAHLLAAFRCGSVFAMQVAQVRAPDADGGDDEPPLLTVTLRAAAQPVAVRVVDASGGPVAGMGLRWVVSGMTVPLEEWAAAGGACGYPVRTDADGRLVLHDFPAGRIDALSLMQKVPLGTFVNDGTQSLWTIRMPEGASVRRDEVASR